MTPPLAGVRVVGYAHYVAGPLCGALLADLGAEVVEVEPPGGDAYRRVMPVAPGFGRYFLPLNRGKRSVVLDLKTDNGRSSSRRLLESADVLLHNFLPDRAQRFGLDWDAVQRAHQAAVVAVVSSFGRTGPLAGAPAYDLVAQARAALLTAHASPGDRVPVRAGGIPMADLTAGFLLATGSWPRSFGLANRASESSSRSPSWRQRWRCNSRISSGFPAAKAALTAAIERDIAASPTEEWLERLEAAGVPCGLVQTREGVDTDPQVVAAGLVGQVEQPGLGDVRMLAPFVRLGAATPGPTPAPALGADTDVVLGELRR